MFRSPSWWSSGDWSGIGCMQSKYLSPCLSCLIKLLLVLVVLGRGHVIQGLEPESHNHQVCALPPKSHSWYYFHLYLRHTGQFWVEFLVDSGIRGTEPRVPAIRAYAPVIWCLSWLMALFQALFLLLGDLPTGVLDPSGPLPAILGHMADCSF